MKNTSDPDAKSAIIGEPTSAVASDSLAARSLAFQRVNPTESLGVEGGNSNFANTDISSATTFPPASNASAREVNFEDQDVRYPEATGGIPRFAGNHNADGTYSGGSTQAQEETKRSQGETIRHTKTEETSTGSDNALSSSDSTLTGSEHPKLTGDDTTNTRRTTAISELTSANPSISAEPAPSYITKLTTAIGGKPKGKNLNEGGFSNEEGRNDASYAADAGEENDPGRLAMQGFQKLNAAATGSNARPQEQILSGEGIYDALGAENEA